MKILAYDLLQSNKYARYVSLDEIFKKSDIISLHCPLTKDTHHLVNKSRIESMKNTAYIINTSRGALINSEDLLSGLINKQIAGACLDVYEEEADLFFEDNSDMIIRDATLTRLIGLPNVIVTSHQGFFTKEALTNIASTTLENISSYFCEGNLENKILYNSIKS